VSHHAGNGRQNLWQNPGGIRRKRVPETALSLLSAFVSAFFIQALYYLFYGHGSIQASGVRGQSIKKTIAMKPKKIIL
jgi:hypothetical protein